MSKRIVKIVLTGGPAAGKTTLTSQILKEFKQEEFSLSQPFCSLQAFN